MRNPHNIPLDRIIWKKDARDSWDWPLKVNLGLSRTWRTEDGRPFICIAELDAPEKCTFHCHPDNFKALPDYMKQVMLGDGDSKEPT